MVPVDAENFLTGYHIVFDKENMKLGWYRSECKSETTLKRKTFSFVHETLTFIPLYAGHDLDNSTTVPLGPSQHHSPGDPLPSSEQQTSPTVTPPAVAGKAPTSSGGPSNLHRLLANCCSLLFLTISTVFFIS